MEPGGRASWRLALLEQAPTAALILAFVVVSFLLRAALSLGNPLDGLGGGRGYALVPVLGAHLLAFSYIRRSERRRVGESVVPLTLLTPGRLIALLVASVLVPVCLGVYASWKWSIPTLQSFAWDDELHAVDRLLHFGWLPWQLLQPLVGFPGVTVVLDRLYALWIPLSAVVLVWQAFGSRPLSRARFFLSYVTIYMVMGTLLAIALSSAGPCYYGQLVGGPDAYRPLLAYLQSVHASTPLLAVEGHAVLWQLHVEQRHVPFLSISAMPSVHVGVAVLFALAGWETGRLTGLALTLYALVVLIGSVHLGWHYAVDGYVAAALTVVIWIGCGTALRAWFTAIGHPAVR